MENVDAVVNCVKESESLHDYLAFPSRRLVDEPTRHYSADERHRAKQVKHIHDILGHPNDAALSILFDSGAIHGCLYTSHDIRVMRKIYGPCVACIKGKSVAPTEGRVINKWLAVRPAETMHRYIFHYHHVAKRKVCRVSTPIDSR